MQTVAIINEKGGTAKTTTSVNLAAALGRAGQRVLLVDLDGQAASSRWLGVEEDSRLADALLRGGGLEPVPQVIPNVDLAPASGRIDSVAHELRPTQGGQLRKVLCEVRDNYDYVLMDCPPSLGNRLIGNALLAATHALVPVEASILALDGLGILLTMLEDIRGGFDHNIQLLGVLACRYDGRTKLSRLILSELQGSLPGKVFQTVIRECIRLQECPASGKSIFDYAPNCHGAEDYDSLCQELIAGLAEQDADVAETIEPGEVLAQAEQQLDQTDRVRVAQFRKRAAQHFGCAPEDLDAGGENLQPSAEQAESTVVEVEDVPETPEEIAVDTATPEPIDTDGEDIEVAEPTAEEPQPEPTAEEPQPEPVAVEPEPADTEDEDIEIAEPAAEQPQPGPVAVEPEAFDTEDEDIEIAEPAAEEPQPEPAAVEPEAFDTEDEDIEIAEPAAEEPQPEPAPVEPEAADEPDEDIETPEPVAEEPEPEPQPEPTPVSREELAKIIAARKSEMADAADEHDEDDDGAPAAPNGRGRLVAVAVSVVVAALAVGGWLVFRMMQGGPEAAVAVPAEAPIQADQPAAVEPSEAPSEPTVQPEPKVEPVAKTPDETPTEPKTEEPAPPAPVVADTLDTFFHDVEAPKVRPMEWPQIAPAEKPEPKPEPKVVRPRIKPAPVQMKVESVLVGSTSSAMINGRLVREGATFGPVKIVRIEAKQVTVELQSKRYELQVGKTSVLQPEGTN